MQNKVSPKDTGIIEGSGLAYRLYVWLILIASSGAVVSLVFWRGMPAIVLLLPILLFLFLSIFHDKMEPSTRYLFFLILACVVCTERLIEYFPRTLLPKTPFYILLSSMGVLSVALWCAGARSLIRESYSFLTLTATALVAGSSLLFMIHLYPYIIIEPSIMILLASLFLVGTFWSVKIWFRQTPALRKQMRQQISFYVLAFTLWLGVFLYGIGYGFFILRFLTFDFMTLLLGFFFVIATCYLFYFMGNLFYRASPDSSIDSFPYRHVLLRILAALILIFVGARSYFLYTSSQFHWNVKQILDKSYRQMLFFTPSIGFALKVDHSLWSTRDGRKTWKEVFLGDFIPHRMCFMDDKTGLLLGKEKNTLAFTKDAGETWTVKTITNFRRPKKPHKLPVESKEKPVDENPTPLEYPEIAESVEAAYLPVFWTDAALLSNQVWIVIGHEYVNVPEDIYFGIEKMDMMKETLEESATASEKKPKYDLPYSSFVMKTEDAGDTWQSVAKGSGVLRNISCRSWGVIAGIPTLVSSNGGNSWKKLDSVCPALETNIFERVAVLSDTKAMSVWKNKLFVTNDGGKSWQKIYELTDSSYRVIHDFFSDAEKSFFIATQEILPEDTCEGRYRLHSVVYHSSDEGRSWLAENLPLSGRVYNFFFTGGQVWLTAEASYGTLLYSRREK